MTSMSIARALSVFAGALLSAAACVTSEQSSTQRPAASLAGTSWRLVQFRGGDGQILTPDDRSKYTFQFNSDGSLVVRLDCNRGRGTWKSPEPSRRARAPRADARHVPRRLASRSDRQAMEFHSLVSDPRRSSLPVVDG